ncbi:MAG: UDP-3-O-(3-hydroxymyristoyl)glucosamine N-acyltransferase [Aridibacter sp.]
MKVKEINDFLKGNLVGKGEIEVSKIASLDKAQKGEISFVENPEILKNLSKINASCLIVPLDFDEKLPCPIIKVKNPKLAFAKIAQKIQPYEWKTGWHETAQVPEGLDVRASFIGAFVTIGENTYVGEATDIHDGVKIGKNVTIGKCSIIYPNCVIYDNVEIGGDCIIHSGTIIGADGFGYVRDIEENKHVKFPQIGKVIIEDDVEIGANSCIDRGALGETRIGEGTKIDNLVQVAHNVKIGKRVIIASQTGISGSVTIEDDCIIAGQVGFADHTTIKKGAVIGAKSAVFPGKIVRKGVWSGIPVQPLDEYKKQNAYIKSIPRLREEIKKLKEKLKKFES